MPGIPDHELLGPIGGGAYGEVWLARSATGVFRAVKVLCRSRFGTDAHPFEREFEGLKRFEPVSREHEHLVDVLHIGSHEETLYYVMELADNTEGESPGSAGFDPARYRPDTLSARLARRGRLPIDECIAIARSLALGLEHLHGRGLIHRDVKPSNVVFVGGVLKLADVGLVSAPDLTVSLVGTEGFIPPEGPGTVQADLFALGKVLYEASSGLDRMEFPAVPDWVCDEPDAARWSEFNEVVLKCCEREPARRYASARALLDDLALLERGRSLVRRRRSRRAWQVSKTAGVCLAVAAGLFALGAMSNPRRAQPPPAAKAPLRPAASMLDVGGIDFFLNPHRHRSWDVSPDGNLFAIEAEEEVVLWDRARGVSRPVLLENPEGWQRLWSPRWLGSADQLACLAWRGGPEADTSFERAVLIIDANGGRVGRVLYRTEQLLHRLAVSPATGMLALAAYGGAAGPSGLLGIDIESGDATVVKAGRGFGMSDFSPDGKWLALSRERKGRGGEVVHEVSLLAFADGTEFDVTQHNAFAGHATWSRDGETLYYVAGDTICGELRLNLWRLRLDPEWTRPPDPPERVERFRDTQVLFPQVISDTGQVVVAVSRQNLKQWVGPAAAPEESVHLVSGMAPRLSQDGNWLFFIDARTGHEGLYRIAVEGDRPAERLTDEIPLVYDLAPSGEMVGVALPSARGVKIVRNDLDASPQQSRVLTEVSGEGGVDVAWSPDSRQLAFTNGPDLFVVNAGGSNRRHLATVADWDENAWEGSLCWSPDGSFVAGYGFPDAMAMEKGRNQVFVVEVATGNLRLVTPDEGEWYKEGLRWHPRENRLTYMIYGPSSGPGQEGRSQIREAYPDGRPTTLLVERFGGYWDWVGTWHPDGERLYFLSGRDPSDGKYLRILNRRSGTITDAPPPIDRANRLPQWSRDGSVIAWSTESTTKQLWVLDVE